MAIRVISLFVLVMFIGGCASCDGKFFLGWGKYKSNPDGTFEMESNSPIKDILSINAIKD